jgi:hypothetical protein
MKVLYCTKCKSLVWLTRREVRRCKCRKVQGQYLKDGRHAEISQNPQTISIAIDNSSWKTALKKMRWLERHKPKSTREDYKSFSSIAAWVRPNSGPGNPHSNKLKWKLKNN